ncbi:MAG: PASTA domain-containing protein [Planctomycetota bacterium]|nr:PASTA domain-containing protein [Planctomycetota bacterium]
MRRLTLRSPIRSRAARAAATVLGALLLVLTGPAPDAHADRHEHDRRRHGGVHAFELPDVANRREAAAIRELEALGLRCRTEHVASDRVGRVLSTVPAAGAWIDRSHEIVIHVGIPIRVQTIVPTIRRQQADAVIESLQDIYAIAIDAVRGPAHLEGRVIGQHPRAGATLPFRGLLRLRVVDNRTTVPHVEGLRLRRALRQLERAGLRADVHEVPQHGIDRPTVIRQRPRAGRRVPYDTAIRLRVAVPAFTHGRDGRHGYDRDRDRNRFPDRIDRDRRGITTVPDVRGLDAEAAVRLLRRLGFQVDLSRRGRHAEGIVGSQSPQAGSRVAPGSTVTLMLTHAWIPGQRRFGMRIR